MSQRNVASSHKALRGESGMVHAIDHCGLSAEVGDWLRGGDGRDFGTVTRTRGLQLVKAAVVASPTSQGEANPLGGVEVVASAAAFDALAAFANRTAAQFGARVGTMADAAAKRLGRKQEFVGKSMRSEDISEQAVTRAGEIVEGYVTGKPVAKPHANPRVEIIARALAGTVLRQGATAVARDVSSNLRSVTDELSGSIEISPIPSEMGMSGGDFQSAVAQRTDEIVTGYVTGRNVGAPHELPAIEAVAFSVTAAALSLMAQRPPSGAAEPAFDRLAGLAASRHISFC